MLDHILIGLHLREVIIFLGAMTIILPITHRLRMSSVLGFLAIGLLLGPYGLPQLGPTFPWIRYILITDYDGIKALGELGIMFLFFMVGMSLSYQRLKEMRRYVFGLGLLQVVITSALISMIAFGFGNSAQGSIVLGISLSLSSTAIVMQLLTERWRMNSLLGRASFAVLLIQDLAMLPVLLLVGMIGEHSQETIIITFVEASAQAVGAFFVVMLLGRVIIRPLFRFIGLTHSRDMFVATSLLVIILAGVLMASAGLSLALGAFIAGLLLSETEYKHEIEMDMDPFKGLLMGVFAMSVGMGIDFSVIGDKEGWLVISIIGLFLIKAAVMIPLALLFKIPLSIAVEIGLLLGQASELALVTIGLGIENYLFPKEIGQFMLIVVSMSMLMTPFVAKLASWLHDHLDRKYGEVRIKERVADSQSLSRHIIIAGFGRTGQMLGEIFMEQSIPFVALDMDAERVSRLAQSGMPVFYGNASRHEMLSLAGIDRAEAIAIAVDNVHFAEKIARLIKRHWPALPVVMRVKDVAQAQKLLRLGVNAVVLETLESGIQIAEEILNVMGMPAHTSHQIVHIKRDEKMALLNRIRSFPDEESLGMD
ncbi:MAG: cation:proton antiporter [Alphaproteobacteria bacterium]|nr:cation:proton antiporter [Alphaproteobacteria bacterium]